LAGGADVRPAPWGSLGDRSTDAEMCQLLIGTRRRRGIIPGRTACDTGPEQRSLRDEGSVLVGRPDPGGGQQWRVPKRHLRSFSGQGASASQAMALTPVPESPFRQASLSDWRVLCDQSRKQTGEPRPRHAREIPPMPMGGLTHRVAYQDERALITPAA